MPPGDTGLRRGPQPRNRRIWSAKTDRHSVRPTTHQIELPKAIHQEFYLCSRCVHRAVTLLRYLAHH